MNECNNISGFSVINEYTRFSKVEDFVRYKSHDDAEVKNTISQINQLISNALTRNKGFYLIWNGLENFSDDVLEQNYKNWMQFAISRHSNEIVSGIRIKVIGLLIKLCSKQQEFCKTITTNYLTKIIDTCLYVKSNTVEILEALRCLSIVLINFSNSCIVHKTRIEKFIQEFIDLPGTEVISEAGKCYHFLNQLGGAGVLSMHHINNYEQSFEKLYNTMNRVYDVLFEDNDEFLENLIIVTENLINLRDVPVYLNASDKHKIYTTRLRNLILFLVEMLRCPYPAKKTIKMKMLTSIIERGLEVHIHNNVYMHLIFQEHQIDLLFLFKTIIQSFRYSLGNHPTIKLLVRYLDRVSSCTCCSVDSNYKIALYDVLQCCLLNTGQQIDQQTCEKLILLIMDDILPKKVEVTLHINVKNRKNKAKEQNVEVNKQDTAYMRNLREMNAIGALKTLESLFKQNRLVMKETTIKFLYEKIMSTLMDVGVGIFDAPYNNKRCVLLLYRVLVAMFDQPISCLNIGLAINLLSLGVGNRDVDVANTCAEGLYAFERICQPILPPLSVVGERISNLATSFVNQVSTSENVELNEEVQEETCNAGNDQDCEISEEISLNAKENIEEESSKNEENSFLNGDLKEHESTNLEGSESDAILEAGDTLRVESDDDAPVYLPESDEDELPPKRLKQNGVETINGSDGKKGNVNMYKEGLNNSQIENIDDDLEDELMNSFVDELA